MNMYKLLIALLFGLFSLSTFAQEAKPADTSSEAKPRRRITYKAPDRGAPLTRTGGGTRGQGLSKVSIDLLAPQQTGLTSQAQPKILYFLSAPTDKPVILAITHVKSRETLVEHVDKGPKQAGIHAVDLSSLNVKLEPNNEYKIVAVVAENQNDDSQNATSAARLRRTDTPAPPAGADKVATAAACAEQGLWFDAHSALHDAITANPTDKDLHQMRADLLAAENLKAAAEYERAASQ